MRELVIARLHRVVDSLNRKWAWVHDDPIVLVDLHVTTDADLLEMLMKYHAQDCSPC